MSKNKMTKNHPHPRVRRNFLHWLWIGLGGIVAVEFLALCLSFLNPVKKNKVPGHPEKIIDAGNIDAFEPGTVTAFVQGQFYMVRLKDGGFIALSSKCTHLGCSVPWDEEKKQFICPCHSSKFDITGDVLSPPAPRALDIFNVDISNHKLSVDIGHRIRRKKFSTDQTVYPESIKSKTKTG